MVTLTMSKTLSPDSTSFLSWGKPKDSIISLWFHLWFHFLCSVWGQQYSKTRIMKKESKMQRRARKREVQETTKQEIPCTVQWGKNRIFMMAWRWGDGIWKEMIQCSLAVHQAVGLKCGGRNSGKRAVMKRWVSEGGEGTRETKPQKSTHKLSDEHLNVPFIFPQPLPSASPPPYMWKLQKRMTQAQNHQWAITIVLLLKCHIQAPLYCHSEIY